jgi:hypothetical protein
MYLESYLNSIPLHQKSSIKEVSKSFIDKLKKTDPKQKLVIHFYWVMFKVGKQERFLV